MSDAVSHGDKFKLTHIAIAHEPFEQQHRRFTSIKARFEKSFDHKSFRDNKHNPPAFCQGSAYD